MTLANLRSALAFLSAYGISSSAHRPRPTYRAVGDGPFLNMPTDRAYRTTDTDIVECDPLGESNGGAELAMAIRRERARCEVIISAGRSMGDLALAQHLAFNTTATRVQAIRLLEISPNATPFGNAVGGDFGHRPRYDRQAAEAAAEVAASIAAARDKRLAMVAGERTAGPRGPAVPPQRTGETGGAEAKTGLKRLVNPVERDCDQ